MINPSVAVDALKLRNFLKNNPIDPKKVFEDSKYNEEKKLFVYTFQCAFETEKELENFKRLGKIIQIGILDVNAD